jgi:pimeloyl-ACP methyl ester carboxylesterase
MTYISIRGLSLYYEEWGEPASEHAVLLAHGLMGSIAHMARFAERPADIAAKGLRVVAYDARGHGRSTYTKDRADYCWAALAEDMHALIQALGLTRPTVYGGSMGAGTALMLALNHPESVGKLILQSPPPFGDDLIPIAKTFGALATSFQFLGVALTARLAAITARRQNLSADSAADLRRFLGSQRRASVVPAIRGVLLDKPQLPVERFREIEHSTLILTHPDDPLHPIASGEILHDLLPHARLAVAPTATYWEENPDALTHVIAAFAKGAPIAAGLPQRHTHDGAVPR